MKRTDTIQKVIAFFLLVVFSISIAPKVFFHDALANHKDATTCFHADNRFCLHQQGFHCHFDDLVVSAPFLQQAENSFSFTTLIYPVKTFSFYQHSGQLYLQHKESRGPPCS